MGNGTVLTYAAVTPARDEVEHLRRLAESLVSQSTRPVRWVIVENGSEDGTLALAQALARAHSWIQVIRIEGSPAYERTMAETAFQAGVDALGTVGDLVSKLDADVSFDVEYFHGVIEAFERDSQLGIASGAMLEEHRERWREVTLLGDHCWGPTRTYRRSCLSVALPLEGALFSYLDETKAHIAGFTTRTLRDLSFRHHRPRPPYDRSIWGHWYRQGAGAYELGYRPSYLLMRCGYRARHQPSAVALIVGYVSALSRRSPRYHDARVIDAIREKQRARQFFSHIRGGRARRRSTLAGDRVR